jgi:hypothetical protein
MLDAPAASWAKPFFANFAALPLRNLRSKALNREDREGKAAKGAKKCLGTVAAAFPPTLRQSPV